MSKKVSNPKLLNMTPEEDESTTDFITRIGDVIFQPDYDRFHKLQKEHEARVNTILKLNKIAYGENAKK